MKNDAPVYDALELGAGRYPHLKLTHERFPRLLATRRVEDDDAEYYGAFLPRTGVRILIDILEKAFRLRSCELDIDGSFEMPCTQYYRRRCVAPCVAKLCSTDEYAELVELTRLVLSDQRAAFKKRLNARIEALSDELEFEKAARFRDILLDVERFWSDQRWSVWLGDAVDTYAVEDTPAGLSIYLVTHRDRRILGRKVFKLDREDFDSFDEAFANILRSFYLFHMPREIRVSRDFHGRRDVAIELSERHGRAAKIILVNPATAGINAFRGIRLGREETELDKAKPLATPEIIGSQLRRAFALKTLPRRIEAFDVAHISGTGFVAASAVWVDGKFRPDQYLIVIPQEGPKKSELSTLADAVIARLANPALPDPDLILLDGGKGQISAVRREIEECDPRDIPLIGAVKPREKHSSVSHFLTESGEKVAFDAQSPSHSLFQLLRDEAHDLANRMHRDYREMKPFYEAAGYDEPLIVPIRRYAQNGGAEDLIPIETR